MKLATLKDGSRDGQLMVVSRDLRHAAIADAIAPTLQRVLDDWTFYAPQLAELYDALNQGRARHMFPFEPQQCMAPLPRAYQWADGSAYVNHVELVRKARGAEMPPEFWTDPLMYQGGSDDFIGPTDDIVCSSEDHGIDFEAEVAAITVDVPMGATPQQALGRIRLLTLVNDVSLRALSAAELAKGFGFFQSKPATAFAPVAVTPDELGDAWREGRVHRPMIVHWNGKKVGQPDCGTDMVFHFGQLIAHIAKTRNVRAGSIVGSGTVSNRDAKRGYCCIAEKRCLEMIDDGKPQTEFMKYGDRVRIEMFDEGGKSIFGAIDQAVAPMVLQGDGSP
jgi:fumarylacetoacetate (FAA) hydrolase